MGRPKDYWALCFSGQPGPKIGPRVVPGPSGRHGVLWRHGPVACRPYKRVPYRAVPSTGPCRAGMLLIFRRGHSLLACGRSRCEGRTRLKTASSGLATAFTKNRRVNQNNN